MGQAEDELLGDIFSGNPSAGATGLGCVYLKSGQWVYSYGMKWPDTCYELLMRLEFQSSFAAQFCITDYQTVVFGASYSANAYVNSREFAIPPAQQ